MKRWLLLALRMTVIVCCLRDRMRAARRVEPADGGGKGSDEDCGGWLHRVQGWNSVSGGIAI